MMENVELLTTLSFEGIEMELELGEGRCQLTIIDTEKSEQVVLTCSPEQAGAIWYLAVAGDSGPEALVKALYKMAEQVVGDLSANLRPIP